MYQIKDSFQKIEGCSLIPRKLYIVTRHLQALLIKKWSDINAIGEDISMNNKESSLLLENNSDVELRKKKCKEHIEKTAVTIQEKQQDYERWRPHSLLLKQISVGLVVLFGTGVLMYRYYMRG
ncbi:uncharacterized protein LOC143257449 [Tachypleus tridentatus]|uniref:uncharacterized protein LOC143257449 n=1 Tax=Tachypleus tridentatus TaxID=6853 RepID=UPI003FD6857D